MILYSIPDIRLFWSQDPRFLGQFTPGAIAPFKAYSKFPPCYKDVSFWLPAHSALHENDFCDLVRHAAGDLVEDVKLVSPGCPCAARGRGDAMARRVDAS